MTKQDILEAIRRTAKENEGKPLGTSKFEKETGIKAYEWEKYWARFGDAQKEAGFTPNRLQEAYTNEFLIEKLITLARKFGKFPTYREITIERNVDLELPDKNCFMRLGTKKQLVAKVIEYCTEKSDCQDVIELCQAIHAKSDEKENTVNSEVGEVYLLKSGRYYKIGKTNDTLRRGKEIKIQLPEKINLIHSIKTDDPSGVESYWHRRFETKRMQGEWFDLSNAEVKAFKCWRRII